MRRLPRSLLLLSSMAIAACTPTTNDPQPTGPVGGGRAQLVTWTRGDDVFALEVDRGVERNISSELVRDSRSSDRWWQRRRPRGTQHAARRAQHVRELPA